MILVWKKWKIDPYGISHTFEKTPSPRISAIFEPIEIIEKGKKFWKEEIQHYNILENGSDLPFWPRTPPYTLNPNKTELLSTRNLLRGASLPPYHLWNHCGYDLEILQGGRTMKIVEQKKNWPPRSTLTSEGGLFMIISKFPIFESFLHSIIVA